MTEYRFVGSHADHIGGRPLSPGDYTGPIDTKSKDDSPEAQAVRDDVERMVDDNQLIEVPDGTAERSAQADEAAMPPKLTGKDLDERARELDIEGRGDMSADDLRIAVANKEAENESNKED